MGIIETSISLSSGGKYRSVRPGITMARAVIAPKAAAKSPLYTSLALMSAFCHVRITVSRSLASANRCRPS